MPGWKHAGRGGLAAVLLAAAACSAHGAKARGPAGAANAPEAVVYRDDNGDAGCEAYDDTPGCAEAAARMLRDSPYHFRITYAGPGYGSVRDALARRPALYVQPGGGDDLGRAWKEIAGDAPAIKAYVRGGGRYLGLCMGAFLAGIVDGDQGTGLRLLPGDALPYTGLNGARVTDDGKDTATEVDWGSFGRRVVFFQGGPYFRIDDPAGVTVVARYEMNGGGPPPAAALTSPYGRGRVGVSGPHPEAPAGWWRDSDRPGDRPADLNAGLAGDLLGRLMR